MTAPHNSAPPSALERLLARDRRLIAAALAVIVVLAWGYLSVLARQMGDVATMTSPSMPGMQGMPGMDAAGAIGAETGVARAFALTTLMWWTMMMGMMLPSAAPMVLLFGHLQRHQLAHESPTLRVAMFTMGYLVVWGAFSVVAAGAQAALAGLTLLSSADLTVTTGLSAVLLALAGVYQLSPLKTVCLRKCRSPAEFLSSHWRPSTVGAVRMGVEHGIYCVGCCWVLMGLLFVVGVMNLIWVAAIAVLVLFEKVLPRGEAFARASGIALVAFAVYLAFNGWRAGAG